MDSKQPAYNLYRFVNDEIEKAETLTDEEARAFILTTMMEYSAQAQATHGSKGTVIKFQYKIISGTVRYELREIKQ